MVRRDAARREGDDGWAMVVGAPGWLLAAQAVGTYAPLAVLGQDGISIRPGSWPGWCYWRWRPRGRASMFGAVLAVEAEYNMRRDG